MVTGDSIILKEILSTLPVEAIIPGFHSRTGRPSKESYTILGDLSSNRCTTRPSGNIASTLIDGNYNNVNRVIQSWDADSNPLP